MTLALVSGADGRASVREQIAVLASAFGVPEPALAAARDRSSRGWWSAASSSPWMPALHDRGIHRPQL